MEIVLTQDVVGLGDVGQRVSVKSGYARNFLLPQGMALEIGSANARQAAHHMKQIESKKKKFKVEAEKLAEKLSKLTLELELRVSKSGRVFGSLSSRDIAAKLVESDFEIDRRRIQLPEPIKKIGAKKVKIKLHPDVITELNLDVKAVEPTKEEQGNEAIEAANRRPARDESTEEPSDEQATSEQASSELGTDEANSEQSASEE